MATRNACFLVLIVLSLAAFWVPLSELVGFAFRYDYYSHIVLIPLISMCLVYLEKRRIFTHVQFGFGVGTILLAVAVSLFWIGEKQPLRGVQNNYLSLEILAIVVVWNAVFILSYGTHTFRAGAFPLLFLLLMVPIPPFVLERAILALQEGSSQVAYVLFKSVGVQFFREGFIFSFPGVKIEVAKQCSGIRSSLALLIASLLAGHLFLRTACRRLFLSLSIFPLLIAKNGLRIVTLSLLGIYVDRSFLTGALHQYGGILFFVLALAILVPLLRLLQRSEKRAQQHRLDRQARTQGYIRV